MHTPYPPHTHWYLQKCVKNVHTSNMVFQNADRIRVTGYGGDGRMGRGMDSNGKTLFD